MASLRRQMTSSWGSTIDSTIGSTIACLEHFSQSGRVLTKEPERPGSFGHCKETRLAASLQEFRVGKEKDKERIPPQSDEFLLLRRWGTDLPQIRACCAGNEEVVVVEVAIHPSCDLSRFRSKGWASA